MFSLKNNIVEDNATIIESLVNEYEQAHTATAKAQVTIDMLHALQNVSDQTRLEIRAGQ